LKKCAFFGLHYKIPKVLMANNGSRPPWLMRFQKHYSVYH